MCRCFRYNRSADAWLPSYDGVLVDKIGVRLHMNFVLYVIIFICLCIFYIFYTFIYIFIIFIIINMKIKLNLWQQV